MKKYAAIILAAGASRRLGKPKQLLPYKGSTLLSHTIHELISINSLDVYVVLGAYADAIQLTIHSLPVTTLICNDWREGMGESLSFGMKEVQRRSSYDGILITLSDLPFVTSDHYMELLAKFEKREQIVITNYKTLKGVPSILSSNYFSELEKMKGDDGAKPVIQKHKKEVSEIISETPYFDVDTEESYQQLINLS